MSKELDELRRMAVHERRRAWEHTKLIPGRVGDTAGAFAKSHPVMAMASAAALTMTILSRRRRRAGVEGKTQSWQLAAAAMGVQILPDILGLLGLTVPVAKEPKESKDKEPIPGPEVCAEPSTGFANAAARAAAANSL